MTRFYRGIESAFLILGKIIRTRFEEYGTSPLSRTGTLKRQTGFVLENLIEFLHLLVFPGRLSSKESTCNPGDAGSIPGQEDPVEEGMATHSSILWKIAWTWEAGRL